MVKEEKVKGIVNSRNELLMELERVCELKEIRIILIKMEFEEFIYHKKKKILALNPNLNIDQLVICLAWISKNMK